jgi:endonuclease/exonuclease/phosphatase family metal-dependent hydrolase
MEWLNRNDNKGNVKRKQADYDKLKEYAAKLDADVIALQEIDDKPAAARVFDGLQYELHFEKRNNLQRTGFAVRKGLKFRKNHDFTALALGGSVRRGADITLEIGGAKLRLLSVHLKSGCFQASLDTPGNDCPKLKQQLPLLEQWIDARANEDTPFLVLGDFNRRFIDGDTFFPELDDSNPPNADLNDAGAGMSSKCEGGKFPVYIDHIVLDKRAAARMAPGSFNQLIYDPADESTFRLSDHCPIFIRLAIP